MAEVVLSGLRADALSSYLSALGLFRVFAHQKDRGATLRFRTDGVPVLESDALTGPGDLVDWVLTAYRPTPIASPWNSGAGFYGSSMAGKCPDGVARNGVEMLLDTPDPRVAEYREALEACKAALEGSAFPDDKSHKPDFMLSLRARAPDVYLEWMDAAVVLEGAEARYPGLLGTGGNDGRFDFGNNFMLRLCKAVPFQGCPVAASSDTAALLRGLLFGEVVKGLSKSTSGQFDPSSVGGSNADQGFGGDSLSNPWGFVWIIEGSLWFAASASRRLGSHGRASAAFPFHAAAVGVGYGTAERTENARTEIWVPLWSGAAGVRETHALFAEARSQVGRRRSTSGLDYARAVASLGTSAGVDAFQRFSLLERNGLSYIAVPAGRFRVTASRQVDLLRRIEGWTRAYERFANTANAPRYGTALRRYEDAVLELTRRPEDPGRLAGVLAALGRIERELARNPAVASEARLKPLHLEGTEWLSLADDETPELRIAASLAGLDGGTDGRQTLAPLRAYLEPLGERGEVSWGDRALVRNAASLPTGSLLEEILRRRLRQHADAPGGGGHRRGRPTGGVSCVTATDLAAYVAGRLNEERILDLVWALACLKRSRSEPSGARADAIEGLIPAIEKRVPAELPRWFSLLRCAFPAHPLSATGDLHGEEVEPVLDPTTLQLLIGGRFHDALARARHRLATKSWHTADLAHAPAPTRATLQRAAGALLIPLAPGLMQALASTVHLPPEPKEAA